MAGVSLVWFRRDLRLHDHPALHEAVRTADAIVPLYVLDPRLPTGPAGKREAFLLASLIALAHDLERLGSQLVIRRGDPVVEVARATADAGARSVYASTDYGAFGRSRDERTAAALAGAGVRLELRPGNLVVEPDAIVGPSGPLRRYAAFRQRWLEHDPGTPVPAPARLNPGPELEGSRLPEARGLPPDAPPPGEGAARRRMTRWVQEGIGAYPEVRDRLDLDGTSRLSQDLRFGLISARELRVAAAGNEKYLAELAWREFAHHVGWHRASDPHGPFAPRADLAEWRNEPAEIAAWKAGRTGYPVVDAAMRQLRETGFMPNRARMVTASFLVKHLLTDWRIGAAHFMEHLVDGDPAVNTYNWEWIAAVGVDAQPAFRILNPVLQQQRFDSGGTYVRRWLAELSDGDAGRQTGRPVAASPAPIVDHQFARERALRAFRTRR